MALESFDNFCSREIHINGCQCDADLPRDLRVYWWHLSRDLAREADEAVTYVMPLV